MALRRLKPDESWAFIQGAGGRCATQESASDYCFVRDSRANQLRCVLMKRLGTQGELPGTGRYGSPASPGEPLVFPENPPRWSRLGKVIEQRYPGQPNLG